MSKGIVILDQSSGYLQIDMIYAFQKKYENTAIIAGKIIEREKKLPEDTVWSRIVPYDKSSTYKRVMTWLLGTIQMWMYVLFKYRDYKLFIITNPPMATFIPLFVRNKYSVLIYDIYPDILYNSGILKKNSFIVSLWSKINKRVYNSADNIYTLSEGMSRELVKYVDENKISIVPIWTNSVFFKKINEDNNLFLKKYNLQGKFIVQYSGNLGDTHDVDVLVDVAAKLENIHNLCIVIIGEGGKKKIIQDKLKKAAIKNCFLLPWQPAEMLPHSFNAPKIGVVSLGSESSNMSVPSKTYNLMSAGLPILAIASQNSELNTLIKKYKIGGCYAGKDIEGISSFILKLYNDHELREQMVLNSRKAADDFKSDNAFLFQ